MKRMLVIFIVLLFVLSACIAPSEEVQEPVQLKVLTWNEKVFNDKYGNFFRATHPNYELEVISVAGNMTPGENLQKTVQNLIASENPDVVALDMDQFEVLKKQDALISLTPLTSKDNFDISDYTPAVVDYFTDENGQIYGLSPTFIGRALYYNKKMFDDRMIPYPSDRMTWDEVLELALLFRNESNAAEPQYGYNYEQISNPFMMALYIGEGNGYSFYRNNEFFFDTESWERVFQLVTDCFKYNSCYVQDSNNPSYSDLVSAQKSSYPFLEGNIAMSINDSSLYHLLTSDNNGHQELDWGIVSLPVSVDQSGLSNGIQMTDIFSITRNGDANAGWDFIKYVCGESYTRLLPNINPEELPAIQDAEWQDEGVKVFYQLERISNTTIQTLRSLPRAVITRMDEVSPVYMSEILTEKATAQEVLQKLELDLQTTLNESK
ncbi:ABC transporter substrate-binding protein [Paenibacillus sp. J5C_2022]|uniref:ABC transporter substrate-binding protein n=1 Tax=Paenibacillus sp. J5C2022 TaxID=2977129 RepID=UPI0021D113A9|nr:ABC transporter substrate-binding protein [Paenibacillus sp. J5C2022]MCU6711912.1 ABC transporter substrate-binding protein [Paenibacillus sp. J5C2022]